MYAAAATALLAAMIITVVAICAALSALGWPVS